MGNELQTAVVTSRFCFDLIRWSKLVSLISSSRSGNKPRGAELKRSEQSWSTRLQVSCCLLKPDSFSGLDQNFRALLDTFLVLLAHIWSFSRYYWSCSQNRFQVDHAHRPNSTIQVRDLLFLRELRNGLLYGEWSKEVCKGPALPGVGSLSTYFIEFYGPWLL